MRSGSGVKPTSCPIYTGSSFPMSRKAVARNYVVAAPSSTEVNMSSRNGALGTWTRLQSTKYCNWTVLIGFSTTVTCKNNSRTCIQIQGTNLHSSKLGSDFVPFITAAWQGDICLQPTLDSWKVSDWSVERNTRQIRKKFLCSRRLFEKRFSKSAIGHVNKYLSSFVPVS